MSYDSYEGRERRYLRRRRTFQVSKTAQSIVTMEHMIKVEEMMIDTIDPEGSNDRNEEIVSFYECDAEMIHEIYSTGNV